METNQKTPKELLEHLLNEYELSDDFLVKLKPLVEMVFEKDIRDDLRPKLILEVHRVCQQHVHYSLIKREVKEKLDRIVAKTTLLYKEVIEQSLKKEPDINQKTDNVETIVVVIPDKNTIH